MGKSIKIPGRNVRCPENYTAYIPDPLPPQFSWNPELVRALSDADRTIGWLAGEGGRQRLADAGRRAGDPNDFVREATHACRLGDSRRASRLVSLQGGVAEPAGFTVGWHGSPDPGLKGCARRRLSYPWDDTGQETRATTEGGVRRSRPASLRFRLQMPIIYQQW